MVAIALCLAGSTTAFAQEETGVVINGVTWATRNVGLPNTFVDNPEDAGMFYQWHGNIGWSSTDPMIASDGTTTWLGHDYPRTDWRSSNSPCPMGWRVPTEVEMKSIVYSVDTTWETLNGVEGRYFSDGNGSIFLPCAGYRSRDSGKLFGYVGDYWGPSGRYWTATLDKGYGCLLAFTNGSDGGSIIGNNSQGSGEVSYGYCIRCVKDNSTGINEVQADTENPTVTGYFDVLGRKLNEEPMKGFYIIQYDNGKTKKIMK
jgi:uncharacterized protein (TIGR02145 family)